ncbi:MAG TPA: translocation/assembly module TamB domain-containing protein, partial [Bacteroidia bacterium]
DYTNTSYEAKGKIQLSPGQIEFQNIILTDVTKNTATVYGNIFHDNFSNLKLDFDINFQKFMLLNTTNLQNNIYYGKAFCSGNMGLYGPPESLTFEINAKTEKGTQFIIPLAGTQEMNDISYISFIKIDSTTKNNMPKNNLAGIKLSLNLEATPDAEVQIILDERGGDGIKARGKGNISMNINTLGNFEMFGVYTITEGSYLFTLQKVINKKFEIDDGSTIRWNGDPYDGDINATATYKQRASLAPFFPETTTESSTSTSTSSSSTSSGDNNKRYPVNCKLYLKNKLMHPDITFGIDLPTVSEVTRSQVMGYINNEQELNRQVFSLLLLRSFVTPLQLTNTGGVNAGNAASNNATEMLSNQLNGMLSKFTKAFNVGFNYRPSSALSNEEMDVALSTQLFNDKLSLDGNFGMNNNQQAKTSTLIGDVNIDYRLSKDGRVHVKAFNRSNDLFQQSTLGGMFTQGTGIYYRQEFNSMSDYLKQVFSKKPKQTLPDTKVKSDSLIITH